MIANPYQHPGDRLGGDHGALFRLARSAWDQCRHGDRERWLAAIQALPEADSPQWQDGDAPCLGLQAENAETTREALDALHPWRKGPLEPGGVFIDTEWRSDWKWNRVAAHLDLQDAVVLDVGCGNGYFGWRMLGAGARSVLGIDPTWVFVMQWLACWRIAGRPDNWVLPLGIEDLENIPASFDVVLSMGVLYHRRDPLEHLQRIRSLAKPGGQLLLETLVLDEPGERVLAPEGRYARMRNVHAIPTTDALLAWAEDSGWQDVRLVDVTPTRVSEQRVTDWMRFESLQQSLDPKDPGRTVEGHPAPVRAVVVARA